MSQPLTKPLPFRRGDFVYGSQGNCFPACAVMCNRYWSFYDPDLDLPLTVEDFEKEIGNSYYSRKGLWLTKLNEHLGNRAISEFEEIKIKLGLVFEAKTPTNETVLFPFFQQEPPIPLILIYDHSLMQLGSIGIYHSVILHHIDFEKEKIWVINPRQKDIKGPFPYDLNRFKLGWKESQNLTVIVYPEGRLNIVKGASAKTWRQTKLMEES